MFGRPSEKLGGRTADLLAGYPGLQTMPKCRINKSRHHPRGGAPLRPNAPLWVDQWLGGRSRNVPPNSKPEKRTKSPPPSMDLANAARGCANRSASENCSSTLPPTLLDILPRIPSEWQGSLTTTEVLTQDWVTPQQAWEGYVIQSRNPPPVSVRHS